MVVVVNTFFFIIVGMLLLCCSIMNPSWFQRHDAPMAFIPTLRQQAVYIVSRPQFCRSRCLTVSRLPHREDPVLLASPYGGVHWYLFKDLHCWQVLTVVFTGIFLRCHGLSQLCMTLASIPLGTESTACSPTCWKPTDLQTYMQIAQADGISRDHRGKPERDIQLFGRDRMVESSSSMIKNNKNKWILLPPSPLHSTYLLQCSQQSLVAFRPGLGSRLICHATRPWSTSCFKMNFSMSLFTTCTTIKSSIHLHGPSSMIIF